MVGSGTPVVGTPKTKSSKATPSLLSFPGQPDPFTIDTLEKTGTGMLVIMSIATRPANSWDALGPDTVPVEPSSTPAASNTLKKLGLGPKRGNQHR